VGPICHSHVTAQSAGHVGGLKSIIEIWTSCEPITKFGDPDVHSRSLGTWMTPDAKFMGRPCILLFKKYIMIFSSLFDRWYI
jgi:hypothetical protein